VDAFHRIGDIARLLGFAEAGRWDTLANEYENKLLFEDRRTDEKGANL
jgi:hypothetical protein